MASDGVEGQVGEHSHSGGLNPSVWRLPAGLSPELMYAELKSVARTYLRREQPGHTLQTTALVHEAVMRMIRHAAAEEECRTPIASMNPIEFFRLAVVGMQRVLIEHARAKRASKRGGADLRLISLGDVGEVSVDREVRDADRIEALVQALARFEAMDERAAMVVKLRFFAGLTVAEAALALKVSVSTVEADWRAARAWIGSELRWTSP